MFTTPGRVLNITIEIGVHIRHLTILETEVHRKASHRLGNGIDALSKGRPDEVSIKQFQCTHGMCIGNHDIGLQQFFTIHFDMRGMGIVAYDLRGLAACKHLSAIASDSLYQRGCHLITASHDTIGTLVVEVHDEGVSREWRLVFFGCIEWQITHQHLRQQRISNHFVDHLVDGAHLVFHVHGCIGLHMFQRVE